MRRVLARLTLTAVAAGITVPLSAQSPSASEAVAISGSIRTRVESWNWFGDSPDGRCRYPGSIARVLVGGSRPAFDWRF